MNRRPLAPKASALPRLRYAPLTDLLYHPGGDIIGKTMSYDSGWKALNLEFTERVPRTEYSAHLHRELVKKVTGIDPTLPGNQEKAMKEFVRAWDYAFFWMTPTGPNLKEYGKTTSMGHAVYTGEDYNPRLYCPFKTPEEVYNFDPFKEYGKMEREKLEKELKKRY